jgi:hypothetical protein
MTSHLAAAALFDKDAKSSSDTNALRTEAKAAGLRIVTIGADQDPGTAIGELAAADEKLLFAHLAEKDWLKLLARLDARKHVVRISSSSFEAAMPFSGRPEGCVAFQCLKPSIALKREDFAAFMEAFGDENRASELRDAVSIPKNLQGLLRFEPLNIVVSAALLLNLWVAAAHASAGRSGAGVSLGRSAIALLKPAELGPVMGRLLCAQEASDWERVRMSIGREMGLSVIAGKEQLKDRRPHFAQILDWLESGSDAATAPAAEVIEAASHEVQHFLAAVR